MAHPYSTDSNEREIIPLYLALAAIASAIGLGWVFTSLQWSPPAWVDAPSTIAFYGIYYQLFRRWIWKIRMFHSLGWIRVPDLSGIWEGDVVTSFDELVGRHPIRMTITQDWTHISIRMGSAYSQSKSLLGGILTEDEISMTYEYLNEPLPEAVATMHAHHGTARLVLSADRQALAGEYYTGRDRTNYGALRLRKSSGEI